MGRRFIPRLLFCASILSAATAQSCRVETGCNGKAVTPSGCCHDNRECCQCEAKVDNSCSDRLVALEQRFQDPRDWPYIQISAKRFNPAKPVPIKIGHPFVLKVELEKAEVSKMKANGEKWQVVEAGGQLTAVGVELKEPESLLVVYVELRVKSDSDFLVLGYPKAGADPDVTVDSEWRLLLVPVVSAAPPPPPPSEKESLYEYELTPAGYATILLLGVVIVALVGVAGHAFVNIKVWQVPPKKGQ